MAITISPICVALIFFFQLSLFVLSSGYDKPQILSGNESTIKSGDNFTVLCQGNAPLTWSGPDVEDNDYSQWTTLKVTDVLPKDTKYKYASRIFVQNATYPYTGFYSCFYKNIKPSETSLMSRIYLYVKDNKHLAVNSEEVDTVLVSQYDEAIIPCRPTSLDVDVELTLINGEKLFLGTIDEEGIMYRYHPHYGFITNNTKQVEQRLYLCNFYGKVHNVTHTIILDIEPTLHSLPKPILEAASGGHTVVGEKLILECRVKTPTYVTINWITPTGPPDPRRMDISNQTRNSDGSMITQKLIINKTSLRDNGLYFCNVSDIQNHFSTDAFNVNIS